MQSTNRIQGIKNFFFDTSSNPGVTPKQQKSNSPLTRKNLSYSISPSRFARIKHDIGMWREAVAEAEQAYFPFRVRMQRLFQDTILNEHLEACWERRKDLTLLRDFKICDQNGVENEELKNIFNKTWFSSFINYSLDALGFGYSLISLGDVINDGFPQLTIIPRQNISPDRKNVSTWPNIIGGLSFEDPAYRPWHVWVPTPTKLGSTPCGFGLFYTVAKAEIYLRNNMKFNADFQEVFGQPMRKGRTSKTEEAERAEFANQLANMGSNAWILLDEGTDDVELVEGKQIGASYKSFSDFEKRNEQKISKVILGHADAMDSTPGKLGASQGGAKPGATGPTSPVDAALDAKQVHDGAFIEDIINGQLLPRMRDFGFKIPITLHFEFKNNGEEEELRTKEDNSNLITATIAQTMSQGGLEMDAKYFEDRTGIKTSKAAPPPMPGLPGQLPGQKPGQNPAKPGQKPAKGDVDPADDEDANDPKLKKKTKAKLEKIYS